MSKQEYVDLTLREWVMPGKMIGGTHYVLQGEQNAGDWVVLVHGIGSFHECFSRLAILLSSQGYRVVQYDLIGRGFSQPSPSGFYGADDHVVQLETLIRSLQLTRFHLIGHSMGGALVTLYTNRHPEQILSLTLLCPAGLMNSLLLSFIKYRCMHGILRSVLSDEKGQKKIWRESFYRHDATTHELEEEMVHNMAMMYENNPEARNALFRSVIDFPLYGLADIVKAVGKLELPIFLQWGEKDATVPYYPCSTRWQNALLDGKGCRLVMRSYSNVAHGLLSEIHDIVGRDILAFLQGQLH